MASSILPAMADVVYLLNNFLGGGTRVVATEYRPPTAPKAGGRIAIECASVKDYDEASRFLHEPHGSVLRAENLPDAYGFSPSDDGVPGAGFPQRVTFDLEYRYEVA